MGLMKNENMELTYTKILEDLGIDIELDDVVDKTEKGEDKKKE